MARTVEDRGTPELACRSFSLSFACAQEPQHIVHPSVPVGAHPGFNLQAVLVRPSSWV